MKPDYLNGTDLLIEQPENMYHFNSDTELLGRFLRLKKSDDVLDIGTAAGALLLYASTMNPRSLTGIDLFDEVVETARKNCEMNHICADIEKFRLQDYPGNKRFTAILCNPPYFQTENKELISKDPIKAAARHEINLPSDDLFSNVRRLLKDNGTFYLVHRASRLMEILRTAEKYDMYAYRMRLAYLSQNK